MAIISSEGEEQKAIQMVELNHPKYLILKTHFGCSGIQSLEGLAVTIIDDTAVKPLYSTAVVVNYSEEPLQIDINAGVIYWQQMVTSLRREQSRYNMESSIELKEHLEEEFLPEPGNFIWTMSNELNEIIMSGKGEEEAEFKITDLNNAIKKSLSDFIDEFYKQSLELEYGYEVHNDTSFREIAESIGLKNYAPPKEEEISTEVNGAFHNLTKRKTSFLFKGKAVLDVIDGILAGDLMKGDKIAVDITERSPQCETIAKLLGLVAQGYWLHTWGIIDKIDEMQGNRRHLVVEIAKCIYVELITMNEVRIKCRRKYPSGNRKEFIMESTSSIPGYLMVAGMALFFSLLMKIFMVMVNH